MTAPAPRPPLLLLLISAVLTLAGMVLLTLPAGKPAPIAAPEQDPHVPAEVSTPRPAPPSDGASLVVTRPAEHDSSAALPAHGEGVGGDRAIQQALEKAWPADLAARDERQLRATGSALLRADATGIGRDRWPAVFRSGPRIAPAFAATTFRVQAVIARRDGTDGKAVVHLVWAGTDRGGTYTDGRITDWHFTRTISKGVPAWRPMPRT
ncbi:hypothetical protein [Streptomyces sp. Tue6028]|uniref:hypothetical protein n=1 Tax=Streptomyces sp. Tue6028 TaxID=2036037 RepID=UPI003D75146B